MSSKYPILKLFYIENSIYNVVEMFSKKTFPVFEKDFDTNFENVEFYMFSFQFFLDHWQPCVMGCKRLWHVYIREIII